MGTELQTKYQKLAHEYARVRAQVDVLKKGVVSEKSQRTHLEEELRLKEQALRKHLQENESLGFRNQQLSKRVQMLQAEIESSGRSKKKNKDTPQLFLSTDVQAEELAAKITENERLHTRIFEITQKSDKLSTQLKEKIAKLEQEVTNNDELIRELNKDHSTKLESTQEEKIMLQAKLEKVMNELSQAKELNASFGEDSRESLSLASPSSETEHAPSLLNENDCQEYSVYNVSSVDRSVSSKLDMALSAAVQMVERFFANLSTVFMYLEQRCLSYPIDTSSGVQPSPVNQKLCTVLQNLSVHTNEILGMLQKHTNAQHLSLATSGEQLLPGIGLALKNFAVYFETTVPYIQLSIDCESLEPVCGPQLTEINNQTSQSFQIVSGIVSTISQYVTSLDEEGYSNPTTQAFIVDRIKSSSVDLHNAFIGLTDVLNSKITMEYQLPFASDKLQMANECTISAVSSLSSASEELVEYFKTHSKALLNSLSQSNRTSGSKKNQNLSVTMRLRQHAVSYYDRLIKNSCDQVPYSLAVHLSKQFVGNTERGEALEQQLQTLKAMLSKTEEEKSQLEIDYQKLSLKYEKIAAQLKAGGGSAGNSPKAAVSLPPSSSAGSIAPVISTGLLGTLTSQELLVEADEDISTEMLIRQHSTAKIAEVHTQLHEAESKAAFLHSQCTVLTKQLDHSNATRKILSINLATAEKSIQQLQDEVSTLSSGYESQLSTMSDHVCELRDDLMKREEELEQYRRSGGGKKKWAKH